MSGRLARNNKLSLVSYLSYYNDTGLFTHIRDALKYLALFVYIRYKSHPLEK